MKNILFTGLNINKVKELTKNIYQLKDFATFNEIKINDNFSFKIENLENINISLKTGLVVFVLSDTAKSSEEEKWQETIREQTKQKNIELMIVSANQQNIRTLIEETAKDITLPSIPHPEILPPEWKKEAERIDACISFFDNISSCCCTFFFGKSTYQSIPQVENLEMRK